MNSHNFTLVNCDTDSISFCKTDGSEFSTEEQKELLADLNSNFPEMIKWGHDGVYKVVVVLKAKNYILYDGEKITIKGSSLRSSKTEKALKAFMGEIVNCLVFDNIHNIHNVYTKYVAEVFAITDVARWCSKKTITAAVLKPGRTNEQKVLDALKGKTYQMGDKFHMYFAEGGALKCQDDWSGDHDKDVLLKKLYNTLVIFENVIRIKEYTNYSLKRSKKALDDVLFRAKLERTLDNGY